MGRDANGGVGQGTRQRAAVSARSSTGRRSLRSVPRQATDPFDPAYQFGDVDEFVRNAQQRGLEVLITHLGDARLGERQPEAPGDAAQPRATSRTSPGPIASRYSGRYSGYPFVRFYTIWNESNLATFLVPQFNAAGKIVSPANYAKLARAGIAGIKAGNRRALVAIGETSSNGRDKKRPGLTDTVAPATFMKGVAAALARRPVRRVRASSVSVPGDQKPTQLVRYPNVTLKSMPRFEKDIDIAFRRKNSPIWITEYGQRDEARRAEGRHRGAAGGLHPAGDRDGRRRTSACSMFIWFVMQDSQGSLWQSGIYRDDGAAKPAQRAFDRAARGAEPGERQGHREGRHAEPARHRLPPRVLREQPGRRRRSATPCARTSGASSCRSTRAPASSGSTAPCRSASSG